VRGGVAVFALTVLGGCAGQGGAENGNAEAAALKFSQAIDAAPGTACALLAPETLKELEDADGACSGALSGELGSVTGPAESTEVYGRNAIVRLATDTMFLARFPDGWRVTAAGCTRQHDGRPYDCKVKGA
jgi:hypothetical protein